MRELWIMVYGSVEFLLGNPEPNPKPETSPCCLVLSREWGNGSL